MENFIFCAVLILFSFKTLLVVSKVSIHRVSTGNVMSHHDVKNVMIIPNINVSCFESKSSIFSLFKIGSITY